MSDGAADWRAYLADFHAQRPGVTELLLSHAGDDGIDPYQWLLEPIPRDASLLDLACGSGPIFDMWRGQWTGVDRSTAELRLATGRGAATAAAGDATTMPLRAGSFDAVACSMSLMLVQPLEAALAEIARVLRPGGFFTALVPARGPLRVMDRVRYVRLLAALRRRRFEYPNAVKLAHWVSLLERAGLEAVDDQRRRFSCPVTTPEIAVLCVTSLYLPGEEEKDLARGIRVAEGWVGKELGMPLRRLVARRPHAVDPGTLRHGPGQAVP